MNAFLLLSVAAKLVKIASERAKMHPVFWGGCPFRGPTMPFLALYVQSCVLIPLMPYGPWKGRFCEFYCFCIFIHCFAIIKGAEFAIV